MSPRDCALNGQCHEIFLKVQDIRKELIENHEKINVLLQEYREKDYRLRIIRRGIWTMEHSDDPNSMFTQIYLTKREKSRLINTIYNLRIRISELYDVRQILYRDLFNLELDYEIGHL